MDRNYKAAQIYLQDLLKKEIKMVEAEGGTIHGHAIAYRSDGQTEWLYLNIGVHSMLYDTPVRENQYSLRRDDVAGPFHLCTNSEMCVCLYPNKPVWELPHFEVALQLVSTEDQERIATRFAQKQNVPIDYGRRVFKGVVHFLLVTQAFPEMKLSPSKQVDDGWHAFMEFSKLYRAFSRGLGTEYIDHTPDLFDANFDKNSHQYTMEFMDKQGIPYDRDLWGEGASCG